MTTSTKRPDGGELHREARQSIPSDGFNCVYLYENGREVGCLNGPQDDPEVMMPKMRDQIAENRRVIESLTRTAETIKKAVGV